MGLWNKTKMQRDKVKFFLLKQMQNGWKKWKMGEIRKVYPRSNMPIMERPGKAGRILLCGGSMLHGCERGTELGKGQP